MYNSCRFKIPLVQKMLSALLIDECDPIKLVERFLETWYMY